MIISSSLGKVEIQIRMQYLIITTGTDWGQ